ncbi:hypothetical protein C8J56DRAFT_731630, partial [Mycena floridula]
IRGLSFDIIHSTTILLPQWRATCKKHKMPVRIIPHYVSTRWNSTYYLLVFVLKYAAVIDDIAGNKDFNLCKYELDIAEWRIVKDLVTVLAKATVFFSQDTVCTISSVIPMMDRIDALLTGQASKSIHPSVKIAVLLAKKTLNRYYSLTDTSDVYRIAMGEYLL